MTDATRDLLVKSKATLGMLKRSMMAHPDHTEDGEFDGFTSRAEEVEDEIEAHLARIPVDDEQP